MRFEVETFHGGFIVQDHAKNLQSAVYHARETAQAWADHYNKNGLPEERAS